MIPAPGQELLDDPAADPAMVRESLHHIERSNRWFGGRAALRWGVGRALAAVRPGSRLTLLDLGTGAGDLPLDLARWARRRGVEIRPVGLERIPAAARAARDAGLPTLLACAGALPLRPRSVDLVTISQLLHHLAADDAVRLLRDAAAVARRAVVVADLRRSAVARLAFRAGATLFRFDRHTRADGLTSIARGYTRAELAALCAAAGVPAEVAARPGYRVVAWWPAGAAG
jgi:SAM-dependent methyltransferase